jgi:hypothetical protein
MSPAGTPSLFHVEPYSHPTPFHVKRTGRKDPR